MRRVKLFLATLGAGVLFGLVSAAPALAATDFFEEACKTPGSGQSTACQQTGADPLTGPNGVLTSTTKIISYLTGAVAIIMIVIAGFMYITSDGDSGKVASARQTMVYALIGVVITIAAQGIVVFILNNL